MSTTAEGDAVGALLQRLLRAAEQPDVSPQHLRDLIQSELQQQQQQAKNKAVTTAKDVPAASPTAVASSSPSPPSTTAAAPARAVDEYRVPGGGSVVLALRRGDRVRVQDIEGGQRAEMMLLQPSQRQMARAQARRGDAEDAVADSIHDAVARGRVNAAAAGQASSSSSSEDDNAVSTPRAPCIRSVRTQSGSELLASPPSAQFASCFLLTADGVHVAHLVEQRFGVRLGDVQNQGSDVSYNNQWFTFRALERGAAEIAADEAQLESAAKNAASAPAGGAKSPILRRTPTPAGGEFDFEAPCDCVAVLTAPADDPQAQMLSSPTAEPAAAHPWPLPATQLRVRIERHPLVDSSAAKGFDGVPPPLAGAQVVQSIPVAKCTAAAYTVRAGEYIQVIDVRGKQCSDFLAFSRAHLGQSPAVELGLDMTATRTLNGAAMPAPMPSGLFSRFYTAELTPLVEMVADTVGRHDAFALACTAKYYEEQGFPNHANCSDNFNKELAPYGIQPNQGWPAINFFYNTALQSTGAIYMDEPWSRAGDYVLLRALQDIVCASSACPDDIDPANGFDPSEIHVYVYSAESASTLPKGLGMRASGDAAPTITRRSAFHGVTSKISSSLIDYNGFWTPSCYTNLGPETEYLACREGCVVMDLSALRKFEIVGPDAENLMQTCLTRNIRRMTPGGITYAAMCSESGGMIDDGTLFRMGPDTFRWVCGRDYSGSWLRLQAARLGLKHVWVKTATNDLHNLAVQGPNSRKLLQKCVTMVPGRSTVADLKWFRFTVGRISPVKSSSSTAVAPAIPVVVSRTGYTGELGFELWVHPSRGAELWEALFAAAAASSSEEDPIELTPCGLAALDLLRIEAGLVFAGAEFCERTDPFEAGIGFCVDVDPAVKADDFVGRDALRLRAAHPRSRLVGLRLDRDGARAAPGDCVHTVVNGGVLQVGEITSAMRSPLLRASLALARIDVAHAALGTTLEIGQLDGRQKRLQATVVPFPFYDPTKSRIRA